MASDPCAEVRPVCVLTPIFPGTLTPAFICAGQQCWQFLFAFSSGQTVSRVCPGELVLLWI